MIQRQSNSAFAEHSLSLKEISIIDADEISLVSSSLHLLKNTAWQEITGVLQLAPTR